MKTFKRLLSVVTALAMVTGLCAFSVLADTDESSSDEVAIVLSDNGITVDGEAVSTSTDDTVYIANDIIYYEDLDYYADTGYAYGEGTDADKHSEEEAAAHTVVHITEAGTYRISGTLSAGQIFVDLGDEAKTDETAVVTLILDNVTITCTVAPAVLFYSVYECDTAWVAYDEGDADSYNASAVQDTSAAGANVIIADGSENNINGSYVAKIYKNNGNNKKLYKFDGAFYSKMSMNVDGEEEDTGVLNIYAEYEGLDSELHLTINGGIVNIQSQDDGINTNEDNVSVTTINGGSVHILAGLGDEGDGIDSNGYLMINGGVVISIANPSADSGLDSDCGSYINGGTVLATGSTMDWSDEDTASGLGTQPTMNLQFEEAQDSDEAIIVTDSAGNVVFAYDPDEDETTGSYNRGYQGAIISCSDLAVGATYYVYIGGTVSGTDTNGLYDNSTVTGFTGAVRQIYTGTDVGMDNMPGTGNDSGSGDPNSGDSGSTFPGGDSGSGDSGSTFPGGDSGSGDSGSTFPGGDSGSGDSGSTFPGGDSGSGDSGSTDPDAGISPLTDTLSVSASYAVEEGTVYSNQFYLTDYVNDFSGVQDDPDYVSDDTGTDDGNTGDGNTDDGNTGDDNTDDGNTDDGNTDDGNTGDGNTDDSNTGDGNTDDGTTDDGNTDDGNTDDGTSDGTSSGNWEAYLAYLISYTEENYDTIAAPDYSSTVEELTAAVAELTEDTYSSSILYAVVTELGGALTYEEWLAEYGTADDDTTDDGSADNGTTDNGTTDDSSADNGTTDDGSADNGSTDDGSADNGSADNGSADNGSTDDGSSDDSSSDDGSADDDTAEDGDDTGDGSDDASDDADDASDDADDASDNSESSDDAADEELAQAIENAETLIAAAAGLDSDSYSADSWAAYLSAIEYLEALLADGTADAAEIEAAIAAVEEAYGSLAAASASDEEDEDSEEDDSGEDEDSSEEDEDSDADDSSDTDAAEVGDTSALAFWFVLAAICIFALALAGIKKCFR